jgi:hypothetical protein
MRVLNPFSEVEATSLWPCALVSFDGVTLQCEVLVRNRIFRANQEGPPGAPHLFNLNRKYPASHQVSS